MDKKDPICGMEGHIKAHGHYFCSEHCIKKYEKEHNIKVKEFCPSCLVHEKKPWYKEKLYTFIILTAALFAASYFFVPKLFDALLDYFHLIWWAVLLGLLIGGIIDFLVPSSYIQKYLSQHRKRTIIYSVAFGFLMSACSHGILAIAIELYKKGANTSSVVAFLLASPWANLPITVLLFGFFGVKALFIVLSAVIIAIITGLIFQVLERNGLVECDKCDSGAEKHKHEHLKSFSIIADVKKRWASYDLSAAELWNDTKGVVSGSWNLSKMVLWWILIGMIFASLARAFVPPDFFMKYMGATTLGLFVTLALATIIEVCSEGSSPMAFEIFKQTGAFGNSFVFLMAGVATDYTEIGLIWSNIGRKAAIWLPLITVPQILLLGFLFNLFL